MKTLSWLVYETCIVWTYVCNGRGKWVIFLFFGRRYIEYFKRTNRHIYLLYYIFKHISLLCITRYPDTVFDLHNWSWKAMQDFLHYQAKWNVIWKWLEQLRWTMIRLYFMAGFMNKCIVKCTVHLYQYIYFPYNMKEYFSTVEQWSHTSSIVQEYILGKSLY